MKRVLDVLADDFLAVPIGRVIALAWANSHAESYFEFAHAWSFVVATGVFLIGPGLL